MGNMLNCFKAGMTLNIFKNKSTPPFSRKSSYTSDNIHFKKTFQSYLQKKFCLEYYIAICLEQTCLKKKFIFCLYSFDANRNKICYRSVYSQTANFIYYSVNIFYITMCFLTV